MYTPRFFANFLAFSLFFRKYAYVGANLLKTVTWGFTIMEIPDEMLKEIRESGYDQELVYNYIRELLNSDKQINQNNNLELIDNYLLDKRFMRELEDDKEYDAA